MTTAIATTECLYSFARSLGRHRLQAAAVLLVAATLAAPAWSVEGRGILTVRVVGLQSSEGKLRFVMFDSQEDFLKNAFRAEVIDINDKQGSWVVRDLPFGDYAVLVHHDVDGSGAMERHWYGKPKEPTGTSNDAPSRFGPPKFKKARFAFESPSQTIVIAVK